MRQGLDTIQLATWQAGHAFAVHLYQPYGNAQHTRCWLEGTWQSSSLHNVKVILPACLVYEHAICMSQ